MVTGANTIDYDHAGNIHSLGGPRVAFGKLWLNGPPISLLDVGCGTGTWLRAALDCGLTDIAGIDGASIPPDRLLVPPEYFQRLDLTKPIDLKRRFAVVMCLEVAEHLEAKDADILLDTLVRHSDHIVFSAACPNQIGQHHVNCQWPAWWQERFNKRGYRCDDEVRRRLWEESELEVWYRQNMFVAHKDTTHASSEPRIRSMVHPEMLPYLTKEAERRSAFQPILRGEMPVSWYVNVFARAFLAKAARRTGRSGSR